MDIYRSEIKKIIDEGNNVKTFLCAIPTGLTWEEGAHVHVGLDGFDAPDGPHRELVHHMSVSTLMSEGFLGFTTRVDSSDSVFKTTLRKLKVGDTISFFKVGSNLKLRRDGKPVVLITMGVGVAAVRPLILAYGDKKEGVPSMTLYSVDRSERGIFSDDFNGIVENHHFTHRADIVSAVEAIKDTDAEFVITGSRAFMEDMVHMLMAKGVRKDDIILDLNDTRRAEFPF